MAYNNYFPVNYQPFYPNQIQNQQMQQNVYQNQMQNQIQMQNGGYWPVRSEDEARNWPVQPGNILTFFDETKPYCYKKAMGLSPLDRPVFEKYRIVKEDASETQTESFSEPKPEQANTSLTDKINSEIEQMQIEIDNLKLSIKGLEERYESKSINADVSNIATKSDANTRTDGSDTGNV